MDCNLRVVRRVPAPSRAREVIAITDEVIVIATDRGVALARTSDLGELGVFDFTGSDIWQHTFVRGTRSVVVSPARFVPAQLKVIRWTT